MDIKIVELESFPPNSNPFHYDLFNMGIGLGKDLEIMGILYDDREIDEFILVHKPTGKRCKIYLTFDKESKHKQLKIFE